MDHMLDLVDGDKYLDEFRKIFDTDYDPIEGLTSKSFNKQKHLMNSWIDEILDNKDSYINYWIRLTNYDKECQKIIGVPIIPYLRGVFFEMLYIPWYYVGNKHHKKFDEFYEFISQFSWRKVFERHKLVLKQSKSVIKRNTLCTELWMKMSTRI